MAGNVAFSLEIGLALQPNNPSGYGVCYLYSRLNMPCRESHCGGKSDMGGDLAMGISLTRAIWFSFGTCCAKD
ncbi:hypothetical protein KCP76_25915 [Salmonella enterica subsp. enterica serovar Weltevreden]|nr:hypothetical protein KCP76_25915 [Salmonella enterica subsp. enterica serovar Weltevreden]